MDLRRAVLRPYAPKRPGSDHLPGRLLAASMGRYDAFGPAPSVSRDWLRLISADDLAEHIPQGTRSVSVFLFNHRTPNEEEPDRAYPFQAEIEVRSDHPFVPRPNLRGAQAAEWDEQVADLHYADTPEFATGHGVSAKWETVDGVCRLLRSAWIPTAQVEKTRTEQVLGVELSMAALGELVDGAAAEAALRPLVTQ